jgi:hypothetical protein
MSNQVGMTLILGRRGEGKSRLLRQLVRLAPHKCLFLVHDQLCDWNKYQSELPPNCFIYNDMDAESIAVLALANAPCTLVYDEISLALPAIGKPAPTALDICQFGRHYGISILGSSQRPAFVSLSLRSLCSTLIAFKTTSPKDLDWFAQFASDEFAQELPNLKKSEYRIYQP